jgi:hypothetical protein
MVRAAGKNPLRMSHRPDQTESVMNSLLPGNEIPSKPLQAWPPAESTPLAVGGASGPPGKFDDTWESVARQYGMDARRLIYHNFKTNNPKEVNFYLRTVVGCNTPSPTRWNWTFKGARPGIIYLPVKDLDFSDNPDDQRLGPGVIDRPWDVPSFSLKDPEWAKEFMKRAKKLPANIGNVVKVEEWFLSVLLGQDVQQYVADNCRDEYFTGISFGVLLGADKRTKGFIASKLFDRHYAHTMDPTFDKIYQLAYAVGLAEGFNYGDRMNEAQRRRLRKAAWSFVKTKSSFPSFDDKDAWQKGTYLRDYYTFAAAFFRDRLQKYLLNGTLQIYLQAQYP